MHRFRISELGKGSFWLCGNERDHLVRVLRLSPGNELVGFDNSGREWLAQVSKVGDESVTCRIISAYEPEVEAKVQVFLVLGLAKGDKFEWVIQKGTELGMKGLLPLRTKRSVLQLEGKKALERVVRWQKIAAEATKQSHRVIEPKIYSVSDWDQLASSLPDETQWLIPYEEERAVGLTGALDKLNPGKPIALIIGPEGGFDEKEINWAKQSLNPVCVSLGPRILRAETAAIAALTLVLAHWGDLA